MKHILAELNQPGGRSIHHDICELNNSSWKSLNIRKSRSSSLYDMKGDGEGVVITERLSL